MPDLNSNKINIYKSFHFFIKNQPKIFENPELKWKIWCCSTTSMLVTKVVENHSWWQVSSFTYDAGVDYFVRIDIRYFQFVTNNSVDKFVINIKITGHGFSSLDIFRNP